MRNILFIIFWGLLIISSGAKCQTSTNCCDPLRKKVLMKMAHVVNTLVLKYPAKDDEGFYEKEECKLSSIQIWDLTDTTQKENALTGCINFQIGHIYHFVPTMLKNSYSNIAIIEKDTVVIFQALNCQEKGDKLDDVIAYIQTHLKDNETIIDRVKHYRDYGSYTKMDEMTTFKCH